MKKDLKREIITTSDGSTTIHFPELDEHYHSKHGAINESKHVFIKNGFDHILASKKISELHILEIGFGTGLNAFITYLKALKICQKINYVGVEAYPVLMEEVECLNYVKQLSAQDQLMIFDQFHQSSWENQQAITDTFFLTKRQQFFEDIVDESRYHLIYFDAFGARVQPELWEVEIFRKMYDALLDSGVLVTYSAKGSVRRAMQEVGFIVERLPGPPGKREMLRATKNI
ncbi:tRNA U34 5-methylaminomethyl-2-thiouridine-forming methyltransferase MnmC [Aquimarina amphilecti]|uniref:tRNA U34 5-methylaminomethyl-2-thiouridine-forming methyltransferase MnmC n=1 Tax=Aquimarina amphilecti TaxID=1038014 RepID=A0A1H7T4W3_AQUAM|nr:tRNA (5-methylaminomethyl-2-thiouridine)(34)-methyltransferase MnmD [Aquimarina amphilecti]SEL79940.1 tRNA U34 5-methylaminomethyl-2-thiouridine-forming methyltransferase MnmC [Aquimarina amphilecti]